MVTIPKPANNGKKKVKETLEKIQLPKKMTSRSSYSSRKYSVYESKEWIMSMLKPSSQYQPYIVGSEDKIISVLDTEPNSTADHKEFRKKHIQY